MIKTTLQGAPVSISSNALHSLLATLGPSADARRLSAMTKAWLLDLTRKAFATLDDNHASHREVRLSIHADWTLAERLQQVWSARPLRVAVLSRQLQQWQSWIDLFLEITDPVHLVQHDQALAEIAPDMDLILYEPEWPSATLPDALQEGTSMVGVLMLEGATCEPSEHPYIQIRSGVATNILGPDARVALNRLIGIARSKALHEELACLRKRWRIGTTHHFQHDRGVLVTTLTFLGEESVQESSDLTAVVGWGEVPSARLSDVIGHAEAKAEFLRLYIPWLNVRKGTPGMKGVLLYGPPGTGKSMFAAAVAGEAGVPCIHVHAGELHGEYQGETEKNIRETFALLRKSPGGSCILVLDEFDAFGMDRKKSSRSEPGWYLTIIGEILVQMDRLAKAPEGRRVLIIATCNHKDAIDSACLRSGRIGHHLLLTHPNLDERVEMIGLQFPMVLSEDEILEAAETAEGLSQADLADLATSVRTQWESGETVEPLSKLWEKAARDKRGLGSSNLQELKGPLRWRLALHLAGHLLVASKMLGVEAVPPMVKIDVPLDPAASGCLWHMDAAAMTGGPPTPVLAIILAGAAAEAWALEHTPPGPGCWGDMAAATRFAHAATCGGFHPGLPHLNLTALPDDLRAGHATALNLAMQEAIRYGGGMAMEAIRSSPGKFLMLALMLEREGALSRRAIGRILEGPEIPY